MSSSPIRIVYVGHEYPAKSETFVVSEIHALRAMGSDVSMLPVRLTSQCSLPQWVLVKQDVWRKARPRQLVGLMRAVVRRRRELWGELTLPPQTLGQMLRNVKALWLACTLWLHLSELDQSVRTHIHCHFFGLMSHVGVMTKVLWPTATLTITGHAGDVANAVSKQRLSHQALAADSVICASTFVEERLRSAVVGARTHVVHCGVLSESLPSSYTEGPIRLGVVARLVEKKGLDDLIRAAAIAFDQSPRIGSLDIIGSGPRERQLRGLAIESGFSDRIRFRGHMSSAEVRVFLRDSVDLFVLPCKVARDGDTDGVPVALMEAMAAGIPAVSTRVGGIGELIVDGVTGRLAPHESPAELASVIVELANDDHERRRIANAGHAFVKEHFDRDTEAQKLMQVWRSLVV